MYVPVKTGVRFLRFLLITAGVLMAGCPVTPVPAADTHIGGDGYDEVSDLFVDGDDPGEVVFETNDPAYWSPLGYTLWALNGETADPFSVRQVKCTKIAGSSIAGYGIVICQYDSGDEEIGETMLTVLINTRGEYIVGEVCDDEFTGLCPWSTSENLKQGYNQGNIINVEWSPAESAFTLSFNGVRETTFTDEDEPLHTGGANGYMVVISPEDDFPADPVQVIFTEQ